MNAELRRFEYGDPVTILISRENAAAKRTCAGCCHTKVVRDPFGGTVTRCLKARPYGKKCNQYEVSR